MTKLVVHGATLKCSQGTAPGSLTIPASIATSDERATATILDHTPIANVSSFGLCNSLANPQVAAATAAAQGTLTLQPCVPVIPAPWTPGAAIVTVDDVPVVTDGCTCVCNWTGVIEVVTPGTDVEIE